MNTHYQKLIRSYLIFFILLACLTAGFAQQPAEQPLHLTLEAAVSMSRSNNPQIKKTILQQDIATTNISIARDKQLPDFDFHTSYARVTNLTEFVNGWSNKVMTKSIPDLYDITMNMKMPLYAGSRIKNDIEKNRTEAGIASLEIEKKINDVHIATIGTFLGIYQLMQLRALLLEQRREEENRLKEVNALKSNGAVTKNDVLRAELQLSNLDMAITSNEKNIAIGTHDLKTLLQMPEENNLVIDTTNLLKNEALAPYDFYLGKTMEKEEMQIAHKKEQLSQLDRKIVKGSYYPTIALYGTYGFNYPDYRFFPPNPYLYSFGLAGIDVSFGISNLYKNKKRMQVANKQIQVQQLETTLLHDELSDKVFKEYTQYRDIADRIPVTEKAIQQAEENYHIVKTKYLNQLALITDMVDADNALLQTRIAHLSAKTDLQMKYYELLYTAGLLTPAN